MDLISGQPLTVPAPASVSDSEDTLLNKIAVALRQRDILKAWANSPRGRAASDAAKRANARRIGQCTRVYDWACKFLQQQAEEERQHHRFAMGREYGGKKRWGRRFSDPVYGPR